MPRSGGAEFRFIAWRSAAENPFMTTAERAAAPLLPNLPARGRTRRGSSPSRTERRVRRHPGGERLGRDRHPADRRRLHPAREGVGPLSDAARSRRPDPSGGGRARLARRSSRRSVAAFDPLRARSRSPLHRGLLDGRRPSALAVKEGDNARVERGLSRRRSRGRRSESASRAARSHGADGSPTRGRSR